MRNPICLAGTEKIHHFFGEPPLMSASVRITKSCNLSCRHCYANSIKRKDSEHELTLAELERIISEIADLGAMEVFFTGGEPLTRKDDLVELLHRANQLGLNVLMSSNGVAVEDDFLRRVSDINFKLFQISLDGPQTVHDKIRGPNTFDSALGAIESAAQIIGGNIAVGSVLMSQSADTLHEVLPLAVEHGATVFALMLVIIGGRATLELEPDPLKQKQCLDRVFDSYRRLEGRIRFASNTTLPPALVPADLRSKGLHLQFALCSFPYIIGIESDGMVAPCDGFFNSPECIAGNAKRSSIVDIWLGSEVMREVRRIEPRDLTGVCSACIYNEYCAGGCRAAAYLRSGKLTTPDPVCESFYEAGIFPKDCLR